MTSKSGAASPNLEKGTSNHSCEILESVLTFPALCWRRLHSVRRCREMRGNIPNTAATTRGVILNFKHLQSQSLTLSFCAMRFRNLWKASVRSVITSALKFPIKTFLGNWNSPKMLGWNVQRILSYK